MRDRERRRNIRDCHKKIDIRESEKQKYRDGKEQWSPSHQAVLSIGVEVGAVADVGGGEA